MGLFANEGVQFGFAILGVFGLAVLYEFARRGKTLQRDKYADTATVFMFLLLVVTGWVHQPFGGKDEPSIMLTAGAGMQLFAFGLIWLAPRDISERKKEPRRAPAEFGLLMCYAHVCRVWATMKYDGYLPSDQTGDGCIQTLEALAMQVTVVGLARQEVSARECGRCAAGLGLAALFGLVCYGSLDYRPWVDRMYASTQYAELIGWLYMADFARSLRKNGLVNSIYVLPTVVNGACRAYFWYSAYAEIRPENPIRLMSLFPAVLLATQVAIMGVACSIGVLQDVRVPGLPTFEPTKNPDV